MHAQIRHHRNLQGTLEQVKTLLKRAELVDNLVRQSNRDSPRQALVQSLVAKQNRTALQQKLHSLHPADLAYVLESLPLAQRQVLWELLRPEQLGAVLLEMSDAVRESLIADMPHTEIVGATQHLDSDEIADLLPDLPQDVVSQVFKALDSQNRASVQSALSFPAESVGALMEFESLSIREDVTLDRVLRYLRSRQTLPDTISHLYVVDHIGTLKGVLYLKDLLLHDPSAKVSDYMAAEPLFFNTDDSADDAALAFERYDLISAPVVNLHKQVVGQIHVDALMEFVHDSSQKDMLNQVGLNEEEDLFAPIWKSGKNRWFWLALNLLTAFLASRVIGAFEDTIAQLVALAALMPIVASIGGNTGNQTVALIIRGLALKQINHSNLAYLVMKEVSIALMNGLIWGAVVGLFAWGLYHQIALAVLMLVAMMLNLLIAALAGIFIPFTLHKLGRDPVMGSSVMLTAITDSMGFFIFLGLASVFLI